MTDCIITNPTRNAALAQYQRKMVNAIKLGLDWCGNKWGCPDSPCTAGAGNLATHSEDFTTAWTYQYVTVTPNAAVAPDGTTTADKIVCTGSNDPFVTQQYETGTVLTGRTFTISVWVWTDAGQPTEATLFIYNKSVTLVGSKALTISDKAIRYSYTYTFGTTTDTKINYRIDLTQSPTAGNYLYAWGYQVTETPGLMPYTKTTTTTIAANTTTGEPCNHTYPTCQDKANFNFNGIKTNHDDQSYLTFSGASAPLSTLTDDGNDHTYWVKYKVNGLTTTLSQYIFGRIGFHSGFYISTTGYIGATIWYSDDTQLNIGSGYLVSVGEELELALVVDETNNLLKIYVNGILKNTANISKALKSYGTGGYFIGGIGGGSNWAAYATFRHARLYQRALTDSEVKTSLTEGNPYSIGGAAFDCPMVEGSGLIAADYSGNGNDATFTTYLTTKPTWDTGRPKPIRLIDAGAPIPPGELWRPYIDPGSVDNPPTELNLEAGLATRSVFKFRVFDEVCNDIEYDPYWKYRSAPAAGTFWSRALVRNKYHANRPAVRLYGPALDPWDWDTFTEENYLITSIDGPDAQGVVEITLKDKTKLTDLAVVPPPAAGKLQMDLKASEDSGTAVSATNNTITLSSSASAIDSYYGGGTNPTMTVKILTGTGAGQERTITAYVGATRTATVDSNWSVNPDNTSTYNIAAVEMDVGSGNGDFYNRYGLPTIVNIGKEIINVTSITTDTLNWASQDNRGQGNTAVDDHSTGDLVSLWVAFNNMPITDVIKFYANEAGITDDYIDTALNAENESIWLGSFYNITKNVGPIKASQAIAELSILAEAATWWCPFDNKMKTKVISQDAPGTNIPLLNEEANLQDIRIISREDLRLNDVALYFGLITDTADPKDTHNYHYGYGAPDPAAQGTLEYGDMRHEVLFSRWFSSANALAAEGFVIRRRGRRRDAPKDIVMPLDPKDFLVAPGMQVDLETDKIPGDYQGNTGTSRVLVTMVKARNEFVNVKARLTNYDSRFCWLADDVAADYPSDPLQGHMCDDNDQMSDGSSGYLMF